MEKETTKDGIFKFRITEEFRAKMKDVAKRKNKPVTTVIEEFFNAEYEKMNKSEGSPSVAGA